jgi:hypothetical protein
MPLNMAYGPGFPAPYQREQVVSELALAAVREPKPTFPEWCAQDDLALRALMAKAALTDEAPTIPAVRQVLRGDEVTLERVSLALVKGPVTIAATDEQARRIIERHSEDAFPPQ